MQENRLYLLRYVQNLALTHRSQVIPGPILHFLFPEQNTSRLNHLRNPTLQTYPPTIIRALPGQDTLPKHE